MNPFLLPVHHTPTTNVTMRRLLLVAVSLISVVAVTLPRPASASTAGWTDSELVPTNSTDSQVNAVSCVSDSFCVAGGRTETYGETKAFLSTFDGKSWTDHPADAAADTGSNSTVLTVSCLSLAISASRADTTKTRRATITPSSPCTTEPYGRTARSRAS